MYDKETAILFSKKKREETGEKYVVVDDPKDIMYKVNGKNYIVVPLGNLDRDKHDKVVYVSF